ncbi:hypothetical protein [Aporhodopirellula aestuarii]|uniref:Uncharacterized protein n=1 Tax=Aporhodopirellula aestuarii TaxID=2950107 RepID=A0ABT0UBL9_9BACT|nr:hypothetical protein [Aporhodopirellula aestuarii]MCM2374251.1 hypothetical protein [Aporhodopirellula aestuarii]
MNTKTSQSVAFVTGKFEAELAESLDFEQFLPSADLREICELLGYRIQDAIDTPVVTLKMFLDQTFLPGHSSRDAIPRFIAWRVNRSKQKADSITTAFCEAWRRLLKRIVETPR